MSTQDKVQLAAVGNLAIGRYDERVTADIMQRHFNYVEDLLREHPQGIGSLVILGESMVVPPQEMRELSVSMLRDLGDRLHLAVAIEGRGVAAITKRTAATTVLLISRAPRTRVFANGEDGAQWLVARLGERAPPITKVLECVRSLVFATVTQ